MHKYSSLFLKAIRALNQGFSKAAKRQRLERFLDKCSKDLWIYYYFIKRLERHLLPTIGTSLQSKFAHKTQNKHFSNEGKFSM